MNVVTYITFFPMQAHAYLDPGTGSFIFQAMVAVFFAAIVTIKLWWHRLIHFFRRKDAEADTGESGNKR